jgi:hypothetical protein
MVLRLYLWGGYHLEGIWHYILKRKLENVSSNWGQLILFTKMIINTYFEYFIGLLRYNKEPVGCKECNEMSQFLLTYQNTLFVWSLGPSPFIVFVRIYIVIYIFFIKKLGIQ